MIEALRRLLKRNKEIDEHASELPYCGTGVIREEHSVTVKTYIALGLKPIHAQIAIDEYELLEMMANERGLSVSAYVRDIIIVHLQKLAEDPWK